MRRRADLLLGNRQNSADPFKLLSIKPKPPASPAAPSPPKTDSARPPRSRIPCVPRISPQIPCTHPPSPSTPPDNSHDKSAKTGDAQSENSIHPKTSAAP